MTGIRKSGFPILYDADVEDLDVDGDLESGAGLGLRFGDRDAGRFFDLLAWGYERKLAPKVELEGTFYGGDLDLLNGPDDLTALPISGDDKSEVGANLRLHLGGFTLFGQYVAQEVAGMDRTGYEAEVAWRFELPLAWVVGGRQLFPSDPAGGSLLLARARVRRRFAPLAGPLGALAVDEARLRTSPRDRRRRRSGRSVSVMGFMALGSTAG